MFVPKKWGEVSASPKKLGIHGISSHPYHPGWCKISGGGKNYFKCGAKLGDFFVLFKSCDNI